MMFVDFAGDTVPVTNPQTGEVWDAQIFVSMLGASGYLYAEAVRSQDVASWLGAHVRALEFYGGSVRLVVPDNLKSGVTKSCWYEPWLNASYQELARWYALGILPARPYRPRDKGAVEAGVQVAEHWILAPLRKRRFFSLGELNVAIAEQVRLVNQTLDKLDALGLFGMALGLRDQLEQSQYLSLAFEERFGLLVDREAEAR